MPAWYCARCGGPSSHQGHYTVHMSDVVNEGGALESADWHMHCPEPYGCERDNPDAVWDCDLPEDEQAPRDEEN